MIEPAHQIPYTQLLYSITPECGAQRIDAREENNQMHQEAGIKIDKLSSGESFDLEDPSLVALAKAGDRAAFDVLASTYRKTLLTIVRRITRNHDDAEDVTQQALMKAFLKLRGFRGTCAFLTWLTRIAINEALMLRRRLETRSEVGWSRSSEFEELGIVLEVADARPNPEQCYAMQEWRQILAAEIKRLKPKSRLGLELRGLNECSMKDLVTATEHNCGRRKVSTAPKPKPPSRQVYTLSKH